MLITEIRTRNFRNLVDENVEFFDGINILTGENAQGKTSYLEAISILGNLQSFRTQRLREVIRFGEKNADIYGKFRKDSLEEEILIRVDFQGRRVVKNGKNIRSVEDVIGSFPVSSFSPDDIDIVKGGAKTRRKFLDKGCVLLFRSYYENYIRYHKALLARNQILRNQGLTDNRLLDSYDKIMATTGVLLTKFRRTFVNNIKACVVREVSFKEKICNIDIRYKSGIFIDNEKEDEEEYAKLLSDKRPVDIQRGFTTTGPHRDDFIILIDGHPARDYASQGQKRLIAIRLLLSLVEETRKTENKPVLLLDDVSSELDTTSRAELYGELSNIGGQIFITATDSSFFEKMEIPKRIYHVKNGHCDLKTETSI